jgi:hypothetical protein
VFLEYAQALFESMEKRLRRRRRLAALCDTFEVFPLVIDLRLSFRDVAVRLGKMLLFLGAMHVTRTRLSLERDQRRLRHGTAA